jgi:hypothetical protein
MFVCAAMWWWRSRRFNVAARKPAGVPYALQLFTTGIRYGASRTILQRRVPAMMASVASEGRLLSLKADPMIDARGAAYPVSFGRVSDDVS